MSEANNSGRRRVRLALLFGVIVVVDRARGDGVRLPQHVERVGRLPLG